MELFQNYALFVRQLVADLLLVELGFTPVAISFTIFESSVRCVQSFVLMSGFNIRALFSIGTLDLLQISISEAEAFIGNLTKGLRYRFMKPDWNLE